MELCPTDKTKETARITSTSFAPAALLSAAYSLAIAAHPAVISHTHKKRFSLLYWIRVQALEKISLDYKTAWHRRPPFAKLRHQPVKTTLAIQPA
ncbi:hypothetical protein BaRGS_00022854 [Batillaria attramentaria]|uniref:Uncharacterized protein n=1 Tax=Batillaria attramentaria TaxID=370345 RepID=A0ABD0KFM2_9CAEN